MWSGLIISVNFLAAALVAPVWGSLADRYGKRIMIARSGFGMAVTFMLFVLASNQWQLLFYRVLNGLMAGFIPASIMLLVSMTPQENMRYTLGVFNTFVAIGSILGPFFGGALVQYLGIRPAIMVAVGFIFTGAMLSYFGTKENIIRTNTNTSILEDIGLVLKIRALRVYFFAVVTLQITNFMLVPTLPLRVAELSKNNTDMLTGILFSVIGVSMAIGSAQLFKIKKFNNGTILLLSLLICGVFNAAQGFTSSLLLLILIRFLFGFVYAGVNVTGNVLITLNSAEDMRGRAFGVLNSLTSFGAVIGPLLGGFMGEKLGYASAFHGSALFFFAAAAVVWHYQSSIRKVGENRGTTA